MDWTKWSWEEDRREWDCIYSHHQGWVDCCWQQKIRECQLPVASSIDDRLVPSCRACDRRRKKGIGHNLNANFWGCFEESKSTVRKISILYELIRKGDFSRMTGSQPSNSTGRIGIHEMIEIADFLWEGGVRDGSYILQYLDELNVRILHVYPKSSAHSYKNSFISFWNHIWWYSFRDEH